jgi:hypothetical protein
VAGGIPPPNPNALATLPSLLAIVGDCWRLLAIFFHKSKDRSSIIARHADSLNISLLENRSASFA